VRHRVYGKHLGRSKDQRTALFKSLVRSLILEESIKTTAPKAKAVKGLVDKIITQAKSVTSKRLVAQFLTHKTVLDKLNNEILPRMGSRTSGYTTVVKIGPRLGDGAMIVKMSLLLDAAKATKETKATKVTKESKGLEVIEAEVITEPKAAKTVKTIKTKKEEKK
jgi:large subunit ribosomal protein L17